MKAVAVIMAGGKGERFWPRSRRNMPKQFLSLTDDGKTMIQLTVERIQPLIAIEDVFVVTNKDYKELVKAQLPELPEENIVLEPMAKNTAPCIGLASMYIKNLERITKRRYLAHGNRNSLGHSLIHNTTSDSALTVEFNDRDGLSYFGIFQCFHAKSS